MAAASVYSMSLIITLVQIFAIHVNFVLHTQGKVFALFPIVTHLSEEILTC